MISSDLGLYTEKYLQNPNNRFIIIIYTIVRALLKNESLFTERLFLLKKLPFCR